MNPSQSSDTRLIDLPDQDRPLSFDRSRLAVAVAGSRGTFSGQLNDTRTLVHALHNGLPNLHNSATATVLRPREGEEPKTSNKISISKTEHALGLGCYSSSSDEEV